MNALNYFDKTDRGYSPTHSDNLIKFWRSKVKLTADHQAGEASTSALGHRSPSN